MGEFELIQAYFAEAAQLQKRADVLLGIGDDAALLQPPAGKALAVSTDTLVEGVHFPEDAPPFLLAQRCLAVNLSDIAAMGAKPAWFTLSLTLPEANSDWLKEFSQGLFALANSHDLALVGGDTTRGALSISIHITGFVDADKALTRAGAQPGDLLYVTGTLGDAAAGLDQLINAEPIESNDSLLAAFYQPQPPVNFAQQLSGLASAAIDVSDGLQADAGHLMSQSAVHAEIAVDQLPLSDELLTRYSREQAEGFALRGGDDYQLCFTLPESAEAEALKIAQAHGVQITRIGRMLESESMQVQSLESATPTLVVTCPDGSLQPYACSDSQGDNQLGYQHFE